MNMNEFVGNHLEKLFHRERVRSQPENVNEKHEQSLGLQDRVALWITGALGTMYAVYLFAFCMGLWMIWQLVLDKGAFDPYPFAFLLFLGNIVQLLLMPLIMVGQNIQNRHAEMRSDEAFKATMSSYQDAEHIIAHLDALDKELVLHRQLLVNLSGKQPAG